MSAVHRSINGQAAQSVKTVTSQSAVHKKLSMYVPHLCAGEGRLWMKARCFRDGPRDVMVCCKKQGKRLIGCTTAEESGHSQIRSPSFTLRSFRASQLPSFPASLLPHLAGVLGEGMKWPQPPGAASFLLTVSNFDKKKSTDLTDQFPRSSASSSFSHVRIRGSCSFQRRDSTPITVSLSPEFSLVDLQGCVQRGEGTVFEAIST